MIRIRPTGGLRSLILAEMLLCISGRSRFGPNNRRKTYPDWNPHQQVFRIRAELSAPSARRRVLAEIQLCPGRLFCPRLPQPRECCNGSRRRHIRDARWEQPWRHRRTAVVRTRSPDINGTVENHLTSVVTNPARNRTTLGSLSNGVNALRISSTPTISRRRVHCRRPPS